MPHQLHKPMTTTGYSSVFILTCYHTIVIHIKIRLLFFRKGINKTRLKLKGSNSIMKKKTYLLLTIVCSLVLLISCTSQDKLSKEPNENNDDLSFRTRKI